ncbi:MAG: hypothetical protein ACXVBL_19150, partial [Bdellovibrionota bacterium]
NGLQGDSKYQARQLLELRLLRAQRGKFFSKEQEDLYQALEWKNRAVTLLKGDRDGQRIWEEFKTLGAKSPFEKQNWIYRYADSNHPQAELIFTSLLSSEKDQFVRSALRSVVISRGFKTDFSRIMNDIRTQLQWKLRLERWQVRELTTMPENFLSTLLYDADPNVAAAAAEGFRGRPLHYIATYLDHENEGVRAGAIAAMRWDGTEMISRMFQAMAQADSPKVRLAVIEKLKDIHEPQSDAILLGLMKDKNEAVALQAKTSLADVYYPDALSEGKLIRASFSAQAHSDDQEFLEFIRHADDFTLQKNIYDIMHRPLSVRLAALQAEDPRKRIAIAQSILRTTDAASIGRILVRDPVAQVRALGAEILKTHRDEPKVFELLLKMAHDDEDQLVREAARKSLAVHISGGGQVFEPMESKLKEHLVTMRLAYGSNTVREEDVLALAVADNVYKVPEISAGASAEKLVEEQRVFKNSPPLGLKVTHAVNDPLSGFTGAIYESTIRSTDDTIVGIAGTWTGADVWADLNLGTLQVKSRPFSDMVDQVVRNTKKKIERAKSGPSGLRLDEIPKIVVTGHSLGGAMSQAFGHQLIKAFVEAGMPEMAAKVRVVGWNGFGGKEALKRTGAYSEKIADDLGKRSTNYYLPNDKVSQFGNHIGEMVPIAELHMGSLDSHKMGSVSAAFLTGSLGINVAREASKFRTVA